MFMMEIKIQKGMMVNQLRRKSDHKLRRTEDLRLCMTVRSSYWKVVLPGMKKIGKALFFLHRKLKSLKGSLLINQIMGKQIFLEMSLKSCKEEMSTKKLDSIESLWQSWRCSQKITQLLRDLKWSFTEIELKGVKVQDLGNKIWSLRMLTGQTLSMHHNLQTKITWIQSLKPEELENREFVIQINKTSWHKAWQTTMTMKQAQSTAETKLPLPQNGTQQQLQIDQCTKEKLTHTNFDKKSLAQMFLNRLTIHHISLWLKSHMTQKMLN